MVDCVWKIRNFVNYKSTTKIWDWQKKSRPSSVFRKTGGDGAPYFVLRLAHQRNVNSGKCVERAVATIKPAHQRSSIASTDAAPRMLSGLSDTWWPKKNVTTKPGNDKSARSNTELQKIMLTWILIPTS